MPPERANEIWHGSQGKQILDAFARRQRISEECILLRRCDLDSRERAKMKSEDKVHSVFILGAGASKDSGAPLMADFLDAANILLRTGQFTDVRERGCVENALEARSRLQAVFAKSRLDLNNIEAVFGAIEMGRILGHLPGYKEAEIPALVEAVKTLISATLDTTVFVPISSEGKLSASGWYPGFMKLLRNLRESARPRHEVAVITFNYDLACDLAFVIEGVPYTYCLGDFDRDPNRIPYLKLHGSLNWGKRKDGLVPWRLEDFFAKYSCEPGPDPRTGGRLALGRRLAGFEHLADEEDKSPFLVPPTWSKGEHHRQASPVWHKAAEVLMSAENIFVVGYSLPSSDQFFHHLYALATAGSTLINRFWVFDVDTSGEVERRFRSILGEAVLSRFDYSTKGFGGCISRVRGAFA